LINLFIVEQLFETPSIPWALSNPYYAFDGREVQLVYEQWPAYLTSINAEGIPTPPRPFDRPQWDPLPPIYQGSPGSRRTPHRCAIHEPWGPLRLADPTPIAHAGAEHVHASSMGGYCLWPPEVRRLTAVGSEIQLMCDNMMPFMQSMTRARMFNVYGLVNPDPEHFLKTLGALTDASIAHKQLSRTYNVPSELFSQVETLNERLTRAHAIFDFALLEVLDACAVLGGVELPVWPPNPSFTGCWIPKAPRPSSELEDNYFFQVRARKLERWGVPLWCEVGRRGNIRLDIGPDGRPAIGKSAIEQRHQNRVRALIQRDLPARLKSINVIVGSRRASRPFDLSSAPLPRDPEARRRIQQAISAFVDPESRKRTTFDAFNKEMMSLLGGVWSGRKHESQHHHSHAHASSKEPSWWLQIRDGVHECGHKGALLAAVEIPPTWYDSNSYPLDFRGVKSRLDAPGRVLELPQPTVPLMDWYVVEAAGLEKGDEAEANRLFESYRPRGALGYRWVLCKVQKKDGAGRSIRRSRYQVELLFKSAQAQGEAASAIQKDFPHLLVEMQAHAGKDVAWINLFDLPIDWVYASVLFNRPLPASRRAELLALAPPCSITPAISGVSSEDRRKVERAYLTTLCHWTLFEYDSKYPPQLSSSTSASLSAPPFPLSSPSSSSSPIPPIVASQFQPPPRRIAQDMFRLPVERFADLAFSVMPSDCGLSPEAILRFQRLALVLHACKRRAPFSSEVFPSAGAPYRAVLRYVGSVVRSSSELDGYVFQSGERRQDIGPWMETIKMKEDGQVELYFNSTAPLEPCPHPSHAQVERYYEACRQETGKTRSEKKRKR